MVSQTPEKNDLHPSWFSNAKRIIEKFEPSDSTYEITRNILLRSLGLIYFIAYFSLIRQVLALIGSDGILPAQLFLQRIQQNFGSPWESFLQLPSIFWWNCSDAWLLVFAYIGLSLSVLILAGASNAILLLLQWMLYMSFVHIGQLWYGYGWEMMLLEAGFLGIFLCPVRDFRRYPGAYPAPKIIVMFYRWMLFRVMFGAGLIKIRGDECWRDLTCLVYHYETQPIPNPISWYLHHAPLWFHKTGCLFNHFVELIVPWFYFAPRKLRHMAGVFTIIFQIILILSGNLSFLNWLTIVIAIACFDDQFWRRWLRIELHTIRPSTSKIRAAVLTILTLFLGWLSIAPVRNMISHEQIMNASFDRLHLINTYGAFGAVGRKRYEIILQGSDDLQNWKEYEFLAKPGDVRRHPAVIAPYQSRIDWQIWFAAMEDPAENPWLFHFVYKLLHGDPLAIGLLRSDPFPDRPPKWMRGELYEYHFSEDRSSGVWWDRKLVGHYFRSVTANDPDLLQYLQSYGWEK